MPNRVVSIELTGTNARAVRAIEGVSSAASKAGVDVDTKLGGAAQKVGGVFSKLDRELAGFGVPFAGALGALGTHLEQTDAKAKTFGSSMSSLGKAELVGAVAGLALVGGESLKMADSFDQAQAKLSVSVKNVGQSMSTQSGAIKETDDRLAQLGFTGTDTLGALAKLVPATKDVGKATELLGTAADLARFRNQSLGDATQTLINIEGGRLRGLASLGISSKDAAGKTIDVATAIQRVSDLVKGQGSAYLDTYAGKQAVLKAKAEEVAVTLGHIEKDAIGHLASATLTGIEAFQGFNSALDGVPGKVALVGAALPVAVFGLEKLLATGKHLSEVFDKVKVAVSGGVEAASGVSAGVGTVGNVAAAGGATAAAGANAVTTASLVALTDAELAAQTAAGTLSAADLAVVLATREMNLALAEVAATADIDAVAIERLAAANVALGTAETEAAAARAAQVAPAALAAPATVPGAIVPVAIAAGAAAVAAGTIESVRLAAKALSTDVGPATKGTKDLADGLDALGKAAGRSTSIATVTDKLGPNFSKLASAMRDVNKESTGFGGSFIEGVSKKLGLALPGQPLIDKTKNALIDLFKVDPSAAVSAFGIISAAMIKAGRSSSEVGAGFHDFIAIMGNTPPVANAAASAVFDLGASFKGLADSVTKADATLSIADKFDAVTNAADKVAKDKADLAGTSQKAQDANRTEADSLRGLRDANRAVSDSHQRLTDSYVTLQDAQDRVKTSADGLLRAQRALDLYNSPRGAQERNLQLDQIKRQVVTDPSQNDAKQLALLQFQDQQVSQKQSLTDAVINAQKGVRDANRGVQDAQKGIANAEIGIQDATLKVADAQRSVSDAVAKRRAVHDDAAKTIGADERKVSEAINAVVTDIEKAYKAQLIGNDALGAYITLLGGVEKTADPGGSLAKNLDSLIGKMQLSAVLTQQVKDIAAASVGPAGPVNGPASSSSATGPNPSQPTGPGGPSGYPHRAAGGPVEANMPYWVNENGPGELFIPSQAGRIIPRGQSAPAQSSSTPNTVTIHQTNTFGNGSTPEDVEHTNRILGWKLAHSGRA